MKRKIITAICTAIALALSGCAAPKKGIELYEANELRPLHVEIKTNDQNLKVSYSNFINFGVPHQKRFSQVISIGDFAGKLNVPKGQKILISALDYDEAKFYTKGSAEVEPTENSITVKIEVLEVYPELAKTISTLNEKQKTDLISVVGLYSEAVKSPRYLVSSLHAKAKTHLDIFHRETDTKYTELWSYFSRINSLIELTMLPNAGGGASYADVQRISQAERMLNTVLRAI